MKESDPGRDQKILVTKSYRDNTHLNIRIRAHEFYSEPKINFFEWVLDQIEWRGDETILDVGCGSGGYAYFAADRGQNYIAGDLSYGMVDPLSAVHPATVLDAQTLPFQENSVDIVFANHMLYHVPDLSKALASIRRVLKPGGKLISATNSIFSMREISDIRIAAAKKVGVEPKVGEYHFRHNFGLESGSSDLSRHFDHVELTVLPGCFLFPSVEESFAYITSSKAWYEEIFPPTLTWDRYAEALQGELEAHFAANDRFRVTKTSGVFVSW
ncbi:MAG: class I SAM-dependent methyltransferase [Chloroflexota bacterium]